MGWEVAPEAKKNLLFAKMFDLLGVSLDLSDIESARVIIANKDGRIENIEKSHSPLLPLGG